MSTLLHLLLLMVLLLIDVGKGTLPPKAFDVVKYGAVSDGKTDNSQAFLKAWKDACAYQGRSRLFIPKGTFLVGYVSFQGECNGSVVFLIKGTLKATTDPRKMFNDTWIAFRYMNKLTLKGGGVFDGQGHAAWPYNDCQKNPHCRTLPTTLRFDFVNNSRIEHLRSVNSKNSHINIFSSNNLTITNVRLSAPADSPNTDGIRIGNSDGINISQSIISTGDDCVSMISGSKNVDISGVTCGPGHGISIGSLGRSHQQENVRGIHVRNCTFVGTDNGVRIKTWSPSSYSLASDITFQDLLMVNPRNPIVIDQLYCPSNSCLMKESNSDVQIRDVTFKNIYGTSSTKVAVNLQCSGAMPCKNVKLINIDLKYNGTAGGQATSLCSHVMGSSYGKQIPGGCL